MSRSLTITLCTTLLAVVLLARAADAQYADQAVLAVLPLPDADRATATVLGYEDGRLVTLKRGSGPFTCLADDPSDERFQVACYHRSLEPYMARGRQLRAQGVTGEESIRKRWEEIDAGTLEMPRHPAALLQLFSRDPASVTPESTEGLRRLTVIYMAYASAADVGLPVRPAGGLPWLMYPGTPTAHVMISQ